jgi:hypothetical protein
MSSRRSDACSTPTGSLHSSPMRPGSQTGTASSSIASRIPQRAVILVPSDPGTALRHACSRRGPFLPIVNPSIAVPAPTPFPARRCVGGSLQPFTCKSKALQVGRPAAATPVLRLWTRGRAQERPEATTSRVLTAPGTQLRTGTSELRPYVDPGQKLRGGPGDRLARGLGARYAGDGVASFLFCGLPKPTGPPRAGPRC